MTLLDVALENARRGWYVFPCKPRGKAPAVAGGFTVATVDEAQIRDWWTRMPDANVGIATGPSNLCVVDIDHGLKDRGDLISWMWSTNVDTLIVRTGRRPEYGVQVYFANDNLRDPIKSIAWADLISSGDVRCGTGYVLAAGSIHPSGESYEVVNSAPTNGLPPVPKFVRSYKPAPITGKTGQANEAVHDDGVSQISDHRNVHMVSILGKARARGVDDDELETFAHETNERRMVPPLDEDELTRLISNACKWDVPEPEIEVILGGKTFDEATVNFGLDELEPTGPKDWRDKYHSFAEMDNVPPPRFLIDNFLLADSITGLAGPVAQRKSIISLNVAHALCTGEPLFGEFAVVKKPNRVLYLCPEMGLPSFTGRIRAIGLLPYVGKTLFCMTMNSEIADLNKLTDEELDGAVVILDTITRYVKGDENSSEHMREFARTCFDMKKRGGEDGALILLHHSQKGTKESGDLNLENAMRGSGELGAFITSCWATRLQDPDEPYTSESYLKNVKQRDFECEPFEATSDENFLMRLVHKAPGEKAVLKQRSRGNEANKDGMDGPALDWLRAHPDVSAIKAADMLGELGIKRGATWIRRKRADLKNENEGMMPTMGVSEKSNTP
jgi:hypothetical protein